MIQIPACNLSLAPIREQINLVLTEMPNKGYRKYLFSSLIEEEILPLDYLAAILYYAAIQEEPEVYISVFEDTGLVSVEAKPDEEIRNYYLESEHKFSINKTTVIFQYS